jgi:hypothetical protein
VLRGAGASEHVAGEYPRLMQRIGEGGYVAEPRTPETTTPTTIEAWAREVLAPAVTGAEAARAGIVGVVGVEAVA